MARETVYEIRPGADGFEVHRQGAHVKTYNTEEGARDAIKRMAARQKGKPIRFDVEGDEITDET